MGAEVNDLTRAFQGQHGRAGDCAGGPAGGDVACQHKVLREFPASCA